MGYVAEVVKRCRSYSDETEWFEYKKGSAVSTVDEIGEYISALSNGACMKGEAAGYLIWGIDDETHNLVGTNFRYTRDIEHEPFEHRLYRNVSPAIFCHFDEETIDGKRIVVLTIPAARISPTSYKGERLIRMGSSKVQLKNNPEREAALFRVLNYGPRSLLNTESRFTELTFDQLFLYYKTKGIKLSTRTFKTNLELLTKDGKYNMLAQLLSDDPHIPIRFSVFNGKTKASIMYAVREYGNMCLLLSLDKVLDFGDTLNIPQADERNRVVERKEVMLFNADAFREAVINAFVHNDWLNENSPMFTAYEDRIEIASLGTLPPGQTREGFFGGYSIPVNMKLAEIFLQLHISERSGRGVPRIVSEYGEDAFAFKDNAIVVTIPYNRIGDASFVPHVLEDDSRESENTPQNQGNMFQGSESTAQVLESTAQGLEGTAQGLEGTAQCLEGTAQCLEGTAQGLEGITCEKKCSAPLGRKLTEDELKIIEDKILSFCTIPRGIDEITKLLDYKSRRIIHKYINPLIEKGRLARTIPNKPSSMNQKYITIR